MKLEIKSPADLINKAYLKQPPTRGELELFCAALDNLLGHLQNHNREEHQKNQISDFLKDVWYRKTNLVNTSGDIDLAIYDGLSASTPVSVIIETKSSANSAEMMSRDKPNAKAFHEIILYYLREVFDKGNFGIKNLIVTNSHEWFVFDGVWFERNVRRDGALVKAYKSFKAEGHDNRHFYESIAKPWLETFEEPIPCCWFDLRSAGTTPNPLLERKEGAFNSSPLILGGAGGGKVSGAKVNPDLIALYKFLSPQHLLKLPIANDSNSLNREFYGELLHIVGLEEVKEKGKKLIRRVACERRNEGALLENTINLLNVRQALDGVKNLSEYGAEMGDQYFSVALELCITWLNRILFLKLLEGRLIAWHPDEAGHAFLNNQRIADYDELQELFFEVLARKQADRTGDVKAKFGDIPYLNSSLFEMTQLEKNALQISNLKTRLTIPLHNSTVLKTDAGKRRTGDQNTLQYLFEFLDSYDFASEGKSDLKETPKTIINASVLGLIFEKINGYRDGSFYTPGYITMYMSREAIRRMVLQKFNERYGWSCTDFIGLHNALGRVDIKEANEIVNSIKVCDPAVGSGHFLVSALNEIVAIKGELQILTDKNGRLLRDYAISVENDELKIMDGHTPFVYRPDNEESGRVQETLFREKAAIIENCLFGVDINPKSVAICRLRLWIELLKSAYYTTPTTPNPLLERKEGAFNSSPPVLGGAGGSKVFGSGCKVLETLPNIDINIKCGNSLVSRFSLNDDKTGLSHYAPVERKRLKELTKRYKEKVWLYKLGEKGPSNKGILRREIEAIKEEWRTFSLPSDFYMKELFNIKNELTQAVFEFDEVGHQKREKLHERATELEVMIAARQNTVYSNAFEWRFEFPEVLDEEGSFTGFDVVIGNPPYIRQEELGLSKQYLQEHYSTYSGTADLYIFFVERAFELIRDCGYFGYIMPNKWMKAGYGLGVRVLFKNYRLLQIDDFGDLQIFDEATTYPCIVSACKSTASSSFYATAISTLDFKDDLASYVRENRFKVTPDMLSDDSWTLTGVDRINFLNRLKISCATLATYLDNEAYYGIKTGLTEAFVVDAASRDKLINEDPKSVEVIRPFVLGRNLQPYAPPTADKFLIFLPKGITNAKRGNTLPEEWLREYYPAIYQFLKPFEEIATKRSDKGDYWWEIRACDYYDIFALPKIMYQKFQVKPCFVYDEQGLFCNDSMWVIPKADKFLFAILNSRMGWFLIGNYCTAIQNGFQLIFKYFGQIPIPYATPEEQTPIINLVDQILSAKKADPKADTTELELSIDSLVYRLYGLDDAERTLVEGAK